MHPVGVHSNGVANPDKHNIADTSSNEADPFVAPSNTDTRIVAARNQAAAPPVYLLVFAVAPFFAAIYISSTRYSDFRHHGFDVLFGFLIGTVTAIFAFRFYHLPMSHGAGWSWGPRSSDRAFWSGVGVGSYVNPEHSSFDRPRAAPDSRGQGVELANVPRDQHAVDAGQIV